ncbi:MAG TPA: beta-galactosidase, partial [Sphingomicrobium sp.]|nr:beta-galactosidase [Sphingomicrobium sp.]
MSEGFTRREMIGASAVALTLAGTAAKGAPRAAAASQGRRRERLVNWRFHLGNAADIEKDFGFGLDQQTFAKADAAAPAAMPKFDDSSWQKVVVPHDWAVALHFAEGPKVKGSDRGAAHGFKAIGRDYPENSIGWYRIPVDISPSDRGRRIWLEFDGVFRNAIVFVNGYDAIRSESGYAPFYVDIADFLDFEGGPNVVTVRCDATLGEGWFYEGAGIYRHVELVRADPLHIPPWGVVVTSDLSPAGAQIGVSTEVLNSSAHAVDALLRLTLMGPDGRSVAVDEGMPISLAAGEQRTFQQQAKVGAPRLWSTEAPNLYVARVELLRGNKRLIDNIDTRFGIRTAHFDPERGFLLNGNPVKLLGTANHQDHA